MGTYIIENFISYIIAFFGGCSSFATPLLGKKKEVNLTKLS
jgi:hypothetical protein